MKCFALLVVLISVGAIYCDEEEESCYDKVERTCERPDEPLRFPESAEELLETCQQVQAIGTCVLGVRETCDQDEYGLEMIKHMRSVLDFAKSTCQEDNPLFKVLANNLHCIKLVAEKEDPICRGGGISEANMEIVHTHISPYLEDDESEIGRCLFYLMDSMCEAVTFGYYCGEEVKDAVLEINTEVNSRGFECTAEQLAELEDTYEVLEGILLEELSMRDALEKKRK